MIVPEIAVLAQRADVRDGLIDASGMGIETVWVSAFPATVEFAIVLRLRMDKKAAAQLTEVRLRLEQENTPSFPSFPPMPVKVLHVNEAGPTHVNVILSTRVNVTKPGTLVVELHVDEVRIPHLRLYLKRGQPAPPV